MSELPKGWAESSLGDICVKLTDGSHNPPKAKNSGLPMLSAKNIQNGKLHFSLGSRLITEDEFIAEDKRTQITEGDVLLTIVGALGRAAIVSTQEKFTLQRSVAVLRALSVAPDYLKYCIESPSFQKQIFDNAKGTAQKGIYLKKLRELNVALAPLPEQKRIVEKLDEVLAQVDTIKARLDGIPELLKRFRQSVLASAVSGKLGNQQEVTPKLVELSKTGIEVKTGPFGSALHKSDYIESGISVINPMHINDGEIQPASQMSITKAKFDSLSAWHLKNGDVVVGRRGEMGRAAVVRATEEKPLLCGTGSMILRGNENIQPDYLCYAIRSPLAVSYFNNASVGSTMVNLNQKVIKSLAIYVPSMKEQKEIVRLVDQYFAFADTIEAQVKKAQTRVDNLTQSILAKAFRGELVPQDENDEPADKLLERIAKARTEAEALAKAAKKAEAANKRAEKAKK